MKRLFVLVVCLVVLALPAAGFDEEYEDYGYEGEEPAPVPVETGSDAVVQHRAGAGLGFNFISGGFIFGGNYEYVLTDAIGVGGLFRYSKWTKSGFDWSAMYIAGQGNFHFDVGIENLTFFGGLALGLAIVSSDDPGADSGLFFAFQGGARYALTRSLFATGRLSAGSRGYGGLEVGLELDF